MADSQQMTPKQMLKCGIENYKKRLKANKGYNFQYWNERHERLLQNGWNLFLIKKSATTQWSKIFNRYSTASVLHAKMFVEQLRNEGNYARIVCGYNKNKQKIKMYSIIYKSKPKPHD